MNPLLATGHISIWLLLAGLFFPRLVLLLAAFVFGGYPSNPLSDLANFILWLLVPRFLIAYYVSLDIGIYNVWFWAYIVTGIVGLFGEPSFVRRRVVRRRVVTRDGSGTTTVEEIEEGGTIERIALAPDGGIAAGGGERALDDGAEGKEAAQPGLGQVAGPAQEQERKRIVESGDEQLVANIERGTGRKVARERRAIMANRDGGILVDLEAAPLRVEVERNFLGDVAELLLVAAELEEEFALEERTAADEVVARRRIGREGADGVEIVVALGDDEGEGERIGTRLQPGGGGGEVAEDGEGIVVHLQEKRRGKHAGEVVAAPGDVARAGGALETHAREAFAQGFWRELDRAVVEHDGFVRAEAVFLEFPQGDAELVPAVARGDADADLFQRGHERRKLALFILGARAARRRSRVGRAGLEPATKCLKGACSTIELTTRKS